MQINSKAKNIQECFQDCLYEVPNFQRPYSWEDDQLEDYWNDVALAKSDFFFGTTVTWISQRRNLFRNTFSLIDGQQRITTSAVALSVVRDSFTLIGGSVDDNEADAHSRVTEQIAITQKYLVAKDDNSEEYAVLTRPEDMFWEVIQKPDSIPSGATWDASAKLVGKARGFFENKVTAELEQLPDLEAKMTRLKELRNNILQARVIQVELDAEEDAFLIFETLNTRGADLKLADLVKNMLVRGISKEPRDRGAVATRWQRIVDNVTGYGDEPDSINRFIWQSWNSRRDAVKEPELYKELKRFIQAGYITHESYLSELEVDAEIYSHLERRQEFPAKKTGVRQGLSIAEVQDSIRALEVFNVSVANSAIVALIRKFNETNYITEKQLKRAVAAIENFHFQFSAMASSGSTGGTRGRYNRFSVTLEDSGSKREVSEAIDDFVARLRGSLPNTSVVTGSFVKLAYAPGMTLNAAQRARGSSDLIRYVLLTVAKRLGQLPSPLDTSAWTIEHIVPQKSASSSFDDPVFSVGNLTLLSGLANSGIGDQAFKQKRRVLSNSGVPKDSSLERWFKQKASYGPTVRDIQKRSEELAKLAVETIWVVQ
ncbi:DUF262 domain-containing protein [Gordonia terrae]|uniref:DUF262 domain-containing protein n=1 Tax=Gordonia terrae TaxID=2055 RepID=UPI003F6B6061